MTGIAERGDETVMTVPSSITIGAGLSFNSDTRTLSLGRMFHPNPPTNVAAVVTGSAVTVTWTAGATPNWFPGTGSNVYLDGKRLPPA